MSGIVKTISKAIPKELDPAAHFISKTDSKAMSYVDHSILGKHVNPVTMLQPTPNDPNILLQQQRQAAMAAQRSGRAATILSQPNSDSLG